MLRNAWMRSDSPCFFPRGNSRRGVSLYWITATYSSRHNKPKTNIGIDVLMLYGTWNWHTCWNNIFWLKLAINTDTDTAACIINLMEENKTVSVMSPEITISVGRAKFWCTVTLVHLVGMLEFLLSALSIMWFILPVCSRDWYQTGWWCW